MPSNPLKARRVEFSYGARTVCLYSGSQRAPPNPNTRSVLNSPAIFDFVQEAPTKECGTLIVLALVIWLISTDSAVS